ncbi:hypothetical protein [Croceivirga thetidis]|uniref:DUF1593 domain-containing protein n=1 Tax=Croceivirga thetidis TaxID=2721623 RepID=A0ABX1GRN1_9FLAO|nr:hypothetical protein [Croceivirga thetidis]NKI31736.1 hypothetical protein [Croceivirga thetidis]
MGFTKLNSRRKLLVLMLFAFCMTSFCKGQETTFNLDKDLLLAQYDCKTDIDDLHSAAALATLLAHPKYADLKFHAVVGTYGFQDGLYVPPNDLMTLAFQDNWSDADTKREVALKSVLEKVKSTLKNGGSIWVAEGGQSDFTALWVKQLLETQPDLATKNRIHVVQHSDWNEKVTHPVLLDYVSTTANYHKIPDCNATGNGTPGFRSDVVVDWETYLKKNADLKAIWKLAIDLGNRYNGVEGRYLNKSVKSGGLDFSDFGEVCYVLGLSNLTDANAFFELMSN